MNPVCLVILAASLVMADGPQKEQAKTDLERIRGTWSIVAMEADGEQAPAEIVATLKLVFKDDRLTFRPGEPGFTNYTFRLDSKAKPPNFDMTHADGNHKGETQKGIYALEGDSLKICLGEKRPSEFTAKAGSGQVMYVLKRVKP
jgi:uncharacterized protein (TIGR03067 family)